MKKTAVFILFLTFLLSASAYADVSYDSYAEIDHAWDNQKPITDQEFENAIETLTAKQKKKDEKAKKRKIKKISGGGTSLHKGLEPMGEIKEQEILKEKDESEGQLINIPVRFIIDGKVIETVSLNNVKSDYIIDLGDAKILVKNGSVAFADAECPDKLCVPWPVLINPTPPSMLPPS